MGLPLRWSCAAIWICNLTGGTLRLLARKDLPPTGEPGTPGEREAAQGGDSTRGIEIGHDALACGQRLGRRDGGAWPDLLAQVAMPGRAPARARAPRRRRAVALLR